jgi:hypothetical protein
MPVYLSSSAHCVFQPVMSNEPDGDPPRSRVLKQRWDEKDAARDKLEQRAKELSLEEQANEIFSPVQEHLTNLDNVLRGFSASVDINSQWEHLGEQRLRRLATVRSTEFEQQLSLAFNVHGVRIFYRDKSYQFSRDIEALKRVIAGEIEKFLKPR